MIFKFINLGEEFNEDLLRLADISSPGGDDFRISRRPNFFSLSKELGDFSYFGIIKNNLLVAAIGITRQTRMISGKQEEVLYFHDLKVDPIQGGSMAYYRLVEGITKIYSCEVGKRFMFSVILGSNKNIRAITKGRGLFGNAECVGKIFHLGFPLFIGSRNETNKVIEISGESAWKFYCAKNLDFSLRDKKIFLMPNGFFLAIEVDGMIVTICKIIDQESSRKIIGTKPLKLGAKIINLYCNISKFQGLSSKNEIFKHAYLSYYTDLGSNNYRTNFIAYLRKHYANKYSYIFTGMLEREAKMHNGIFILKFNSSIYCYGNSPSINFNFPELTLI